MSTKTFPDVLSEYDAITASLDPRDEEADFVMRGGDWRIVRERLATAARFGCKARTANTGANDPQDCDWPFCGCDPHADRVLAALQESGYALMPETPSDEIIEAICAAHAPASWPDGFGRAAQSLRRDSARRGYAKVIEITTKAKT